MNDALRSRASPILAKLWSWLPLLFVAAITLWYRLVNLGYSDYQGDEISALPPAGAGLGLQDFLAGQRRGPVQYLVALLVEQVNPDYGNEGLTRLPFALAGITAIYFFYRLVRLQFNSRIALYATLLLTTNGLFIGLTRIAQYQSLVMLFSVTALYAFSLAQHSAQWRTKGLYLGMALWVMALLSHYDGIFIAPFAVLVLYRWYTQEPVEGRAVLTRHVLVALGLAGALLAAYYLPVLLSASGDTQAYWSYRLLPREGRSGISSSVVTFKLYNPLWVFYIYVALGQLAIFKLKQAFSAFLWFLLPWQVMELVFFDPGTHIYAYLMPATILLAYGLEVFEELLAKLAGLRLGRALSVAGLVALFLFLSSLSHFVFIDHTPEYPWQSRRYLGQLVSVPETKGDLWIFGFPYSRQWREVGEYVAANSDNPYFSTNEKVDIASYYTGKTFDIERSGYYVHITSPQSFKETIAKEKVRHWMKNHAPVKTFEANGRVMVEVYEMPPDSLEETE